MKDTV